jgi:hypothetical protein
MGERRESRMIEINQNIPAQYSKLYSDYVASLAKKCDTIMWVVMERGDKIGMIEKSKHREKVEQLLSSGDDRKVRIAEEVMSRTLGVWRIR